MKFIVSLLCVFSWLSAGAVQWQWHNPQLEKSGNVSNIWNQGWDEGNYARFPASAKSEVRGAVWNLSRHSAGLALRFVTDAKVVKVRYGVTGGWSMAHMPTTGVSGVDLYRLNADGSDSFCAGSYHFADTVTYTFNVDRRPKPGDQEYALFLPTYNGVKWMEVGVADGDSFRFVPAPTDVKPVIIYGTSITQGACSSRPGMAWTNVVCRKLRRPVINLGFSGNAYIEEPVIRYMTDVDAAVYVFDFLPNNDRREKEEVKKLIIDAVHQVRAKRTAPILLVEHAGYSSDEVDEQRHASYNTLNDAQHEAYDILRKEGVKDLYYLSREEIGLDPDSWVDVVHYTDFGMKKEGDVVAEKLKKILKKHK